MNTVDAVQTLSTLRERDHNRLSQSEDRSLGLAIVVLLSLSVDTVGLIDRLMTDTDPISN